MRTSILIIAWAPLALLLSADRSGGQGPDGKQPYIFFSTTPDEGDAKPAAPLTQLNLRPNQEQPYFVYVHNPGKKQTVTVQLVSTRKTGQVAVAASKSVEVDRDKTVLVQLVANKAQLLLVPPPADGKPAPAPAIPLYGKPRFEIAFDGGKDDKSTLIELRSATAYTKIAKKFEKELNKLTYTVERSDEKLVGGPIPVKLIPRNKNGEPIELAKVAIAGNSLEGLLAIGAKEDGAQKVELTLNAQGLGEGYAEVTVDGSPRTQWDTLEGGTAKAFGVIAPLTAIPGKPIAIRFMGDDAKEPAPGADYGVVFDRNPGEQVKYVPTRRNEGFDVRIGANGEAIFVTRSEDWVVEFPTQGVFGEREFFARGGDASAKRKVMFDATPPNIDAPVVEAAKADPRKLKMFRPGQRIKVTATAADDESKIDHTKPATIFLGEKPGPDGKPAPNSQVKTGKRVGATDAYEAEFEIPAAFAASEINVGASFTNGVGLTGLRETTAKVDFTPPEITVLRFDPAKAPLEGFKPGDTVRVFASAFDEESEIDLARPVQFFIGDPPGPDGRPVQTTFVAEDAQGVVPDLKTSKGHPYWAADLTLPKNITKETEVKVGVWFVNRVGLSASRVATIKLDKDFTTATVKVKVAQGGNDRVQPGVKVWLLDQFGKVAAEGKTDECGIATFAKVLPGTYLVWSVKDADQNAQDFKTIVARGGDELDVSLSIKRQLAPPIQPPQLPQR